MKLFVDALVMEVDGRGIAKATSRLLTSIKKLYPDIEMTLLQRGNLLTNVPVEHKTIYLPKGENPDLYFPDLVYELIPDFIYFPLNGNFSENYLKVKPKTKIVTMIHDIIPAIIPEVYNLSKEDVANYLKNVEKFCNMADIVLVDSIHTQKDIMANVQVEKEPVVVHYSNFSENFQKKSNKYGDYFLYNGGYCPRKGIDLIVDNFLELKFRGKLESKLVITGEILDDKLTEKTRCLINFAKSRNWIIETGFVPDEELFNLFSHSKALVYPSLYEGFGLPPLEAMALNCPAITTKASSIPEVCADAAYYIDRNNKEDLQKALIQLETNEELRRTLIELGRKQKEKFSWGSSAEKFIETLGMGVN